MTVTGANFTGVVVKLDRSPVTPLSQTDSQIQVQMPKHDNGYAVIAVGTSYAKYLYQPPRLDELPPGYITTVAGIGSYSGEYGPATLASIQPWGMAFDRSGQLYFTDTPNNRVMRIRSDGIVEPFAGNGFSDGPHPEGQTPALSVTISFPRSIAFDSGGNLIVPDGGNYLWRVDPSGLAEIIAGTGQRSNSAPEGVPASGTAIGYPSFVAVNGEDNVFFIDWTNARVRKIDRNGILSTVAGNGTYGFSGDGGPAKDAQFNLVFNDLGGLAVDSAGNLLLLDHGNHRVRRISRSTGMIDTVVGPTVNNHLLDNPRAIAEVGDALYFSNAAEIYRRAADGTITQIASGKRGFSEDGSALPGASIGLVKGLSVDPLGNLLYADDDIQRIRVISSPTNRIFTLAGIGPRSFGEGDQAVAASLLTANLDLDFLPSGELLIADQNRLLRIDQDAHLTRVAGSGVFGPLFDVPALNASMGTASASVAGDGSIDIAGGYIGALRIDAQGIVRQVAGNASACGFAGDGGAALTATLCQTWDALRDSTGNLFIADTNNNRIRRVDAATGVITTFAGSGPPNGLEHYGAGNTCGDGGPATTACINTPYGLAFDDSSDLFVCENEARIRKIDRNGIINTLAYVHCTKLAYAFGNLFTVAGDFLARISPSGEVIPLTARSVGFSGDGGPASGARIFGLKQSHGVAVDREGNLFFADGDNLRVRAIRYGAILAPPGATIEATSIGSSIRVTVWGSGGHAAPGVRVDFTVPFAGASCTLSSGFATTDVNGVATVSCSSNCVAGTYNVTARPLTSSSTASVSFTNVGGPCRRRAVKH